VKLLQEKERGTGVNKKRSVGVTILGVATIIGSFMVIRSLITYLINETYFSELLSKARLNNETVLRVYLIFMLLPNIVELFAGWNIFLLLNNARKTIIILSIWSIFATFALSYYYLRQPIENSIVTSIIDLVVIGFLFLPKVKEQFK
jgi:hypothetical protein